MNRNELLEGLLESEKGNQGIDILKLKKVDEYEKIKKEVFSIIEKKPASFICNDNNLKSKFIKDYDDDLKQKIIEVSKKTGKPNTTYNQIIGANRIYKLFRKSPGWVEDGVDFVKYHKEGELWKFYYENEFPYLTKYLNNDDFLVRAWINGLMPNSSFKPHKEILTYKYKQWNVMIPRIHITFVNDTNSYFNLNGKNYILEEGVEYLINISSYHYAKNMSDSPRYNLLTDYFMNEELLERLCEGTVPSVINEESLIDIEEQNNKKSDIDLNKLKIKDIKVF
jgi:hypothetical protein